MKELDEYVAAEAKSREAKKKLAKVFECYFDDAEDYRQEWWGIEKGEWSTSVGFAPDKDTLLAAAKVRQLEIDGLECRAYPAGYSSGQFSGKELYRVGELVGLILENDRTLTLVVVRADHEVQIPENL